MKRWIKIIIPVAILLLFVLIMTGDRYWKKPRGPHNDVALHISRVQAAVLNEDWAQAEADFELLNKAWRLTVTRVQFSVERDEIRGLTLSLARLRGALLATDKAGALMELSEAEEHWTELGS